MFSVIILLVLAWSFYIGYSRGIVLQGFYTASALVAMLIAGYFYKGVAKAISLWIPYASATQGSSTYFFPNSQLFHLDKVFYAGLAYLFVFTVVYMFARFIGIFVNLVPYPNKLDTPRYNVISGAIAAFITLFGIEMCLTILATMPLAEVQERLNSSALIRFIINYTPITSSVLKHFWVTNVIG